jgi:translation initiation factor IF-1
VTAEASTKEGKIERGVVEEVLPKAMCRVRLTAGRTVRAGLSPEVRHATVRLIAGAEVEVRISPHDPSRGQITRKL